VSKRIFWQFNRVNKIFYQNFFVIDFLKMMFLFLYSDVDNPPISFLLLTADYAGFIPSVQRIVVYSATPIATAIKNLKLLPFLYFSPIEFLLSLHVNA
jgi:hypothetical protein